MTKVLWELIKYGVLPFCQFFTAALLSGQALRLIFLCFFHRLTVVLTSFCSLINGITPKIHMLCFVLINSVLLNLACVWIFLAKLSQSHCFSILREPFVLNLCSRFPLVQV